MAWFLALGIVLSVYGCKPDKQTAAQITELKTELTNVQSQLDKANSQTETLTQQLQDLARALAGTQKDVQALAELPKANGAGRRDAGPFVKGRHGRGSP